MKHHLFAVSFGCSAALLLVLSACGMSSTQSTLPTSAPVPTSAPQPPVSTPVTQPPAGLTESTAAVQVVLDYYHAIAEGQYDKAYGLWRQNGAASGQTLSEFKQGYANTAGLSVLLDRATVSGDAATVPVTILSVLNQSGQTRQPQRFSGTYTLRQEGGGWHIASANITKPMQLQSRLPAQVMPCACSRSTTRRSKRATIRAPTPTGRAMARPASNLTR